mgnify:CR=1 FL=1
MVVGGVEGGREVERGIFSIDILGNHAFVSLGFLGYIHGRFARGLFYFLYCIELGVLHMVFLCL